MDNLHTETKRDTQSRTELIASLKIPNLRGLYADVQFSGTKFQLKAFEALLDRVERLEADLVQVFAHAPAGSDTRRLILEMIGKREGVLPVEVRGE